MSPIGLNPSIVSRSDLAARYGVDQAGRWAGTTPTGRAADRVDVSDAARQASQSSAGFRADLVQRVREQIAAGSYETQDKVVIAAEMLRRDALSPAQA